MNAIKIYLSKLGRKGGKIRSKSKASASRNNGRLGGRPKKTVARKVLANG